MAVALTRVRRPLAGLDGLDAPLDAELSGGIDAPSFRPPTRPTRPSAPASTPPLAPPRPSVPWDQGTAPTDPVVDPAGGAVGITELPDGAGGVVPVPPVALAPPGTVPGATAGQGINETGARPPAPPGVTTGQGISEIGEAVTPPSPTSWDTAPSLPAPPGTVPGATTGQGLGQGFTERGGAVGTTAGPWAPPVPLAPTGPLAPLSGAAAAADTATPPTPMTTPPPWAMTPEGVPVTPAAGNSTGSVTTTALPGTFDATNNLTDAQITPGPDPRLARYQSELDAVVQRMTHGPDRLKLAENYYDTFSKATEGDYTRSLTDATDAAAAHGRLGSGQLTNSYGDLAERRLRDKETQKRVLLNQAVEGTIGDTRNAFTDLSSAEGRVFGEGQANRDELRTERDVQLQQAQRAIMQRILQSQAESGQSQQAFENALRLYGLGSASDPTNALNTAAGQAGTEAANSTDAILQLIKAYMARNATTGG